MRPRSLCIFSPHRDDAAFSCGLVLQSALSAGALVRVVNICTTSRYAPFSRDRDVNVAAVTALRKQEDDDFAERLITAAKVDRRMLEMVELGWLDAPIRWDMHEEETLRRQEVRAEEVNALASELERLPPADVVLAPLAIGGHVDHRLVKAAALKSSINSLLALYEELPYAARLSDLEVAELGDFGLGERHPESDSDHQAWNRQEWGRRSYPPKHLAILGMKYPFALCYPSQIDESTAREIGHYSDSLGGRERLQGPISVLDRIDEFFYES